MGKKLSEMTLEELWRLFPIELRPHDPRWKDWYAEREADLRRVLPPDSVFSIDHIGSTAVETIWAKPIVDILVRLTDMSHLEQAATVLAANGYIRMNRSSFNMGYTENGFAEKVFHIHLRGKDEDDELYFRDRLREFPDIAHEYERLKLELWKKYEFDRDGYTNAKSDFVLAQTRAAKTCFEYMDNADFVSYANQLYDILSENDSCAGMDFGMWSDAVGEGMRKPQRRIILIRYGSVLAGYFQYYVNGETFMMEEIQIRPEFRREYSMFRGLYGFILPDIPSNVRWVRAYAEKHNTASHGILGRLGLSVTDGDDRFLAFEGTLEDLKKWYYN